MKLVCVLLVLSSLTVLCFAARCYKPSRGLSEDKTLCCNSKTCVVKFGEDGQEFCPECEWDISDVHYDSKCSRTSVDRFPCYGINSVQECVTRDSDPLEFNKCDTTDYRLVTVDTSHSAPYFNPQQQYVDFKNLRYVDDDIDFKVVTKLMEEQSSDGTTRVFPHHHILYVWNRDSGEEIKIVIERDEYCHIHELIPIDPTCWSHPEYNRHSTDQITL
jgi:hypothetical protein